VVHATQLELGPAAVDLTRLRMFTPGQAARPGFRAAVVDERDVLGWVAGRDLATGEERFAPAQLVYLGYAPQTDEPWMGPTTSSGLACGVSDDEAMLAALFEAVERDAFMLAWRRRLRAPRLDISGSSLADVHDRYFARVRADYDALDLSGVTGIPTVLCVVRDPAGGVGLAVGAASGWSIEHAWTRALAEGFQTYSWARQLVASGAGAALRGLDDVESFVDHVAWYADPRRSQPRDRLRPDGELPLSESSPPLPGTGPVERLASAVDRLVQIGQQVLAFDVTSPDIADLGLRVVRVLGPDLCWLDQGSTYAYLGRPRLADPTAVPAALGGRLVIDPDPHPFP
jgi:ribosomal protein S12 methylthiotransferase accessory factor